MTSTPSHSTRHGFVQIVSNSGPAVLRKHEEGKEISRVVGRHSYNCATPVGDENVTHITDLTQPLPPLAHLFFREGVQVAREDVGEPLQSGCPMNNETGFGIVWSCIPNI